MNVTEAIETRRSIRSYKDRQIEEDKLERVLEAARLAPSAKNLQEWKFIVVKDKLTRQKLASAAKNQKFVGEAPVVIAACAVETEHVMTCGQLCYPIDLAIAVDHMTLKAVEEDLGTCWIGAFHEDEVKEILNIPEKVRVVALLPIGYPEYVPSQTPRKMREEIVVSEKWQ